MSASSDRAKGGTPLRVVLVGTGTGVGKTHVACTLLAEWSQTRRVVGLKPVETGIVPSRGRGRGEESDQERLTAAAQLFHVKRSRAGRVRPWTPHESNAGRAPPRAPHHPRGGAGVFHVKRPADHPRAGRAGPQSPAKPGPLPLASLYTFPEPVSPHLAAREAGVRIDLGLIERWVEEHEAAITLVETAGGLFSPLGHALTNFELARVLRPDVVILIAPDRLGVLHEVTTTLALAAARGGLPVGLVLSAPEASDASTGRNGAELEALGIGSAIATFPRRPVRHPASVSAARAVMAWADGLLGIATP